MTTEGNYLCVGGPIAGQRREFYGTPRIAVQPAARYEVSAGGPQDPAIIDSIQITYYELRRYAADGEMVSIWVPEDQSDLETTHILLDAYEASTKGKPE